MLQIWHKEMVIKAIPFIGYSSDTKTIISEDRKPVFWLPKISGSKKLLFSSKSLNQWKSWVKIMQDVLLVASVFFTWSCFGGSELYFGLVGWWDNWLVNILLIGFECNITLPFYGFLFTSTISLAKFLLFGSFLHGPILTSSPKA